MSSTAKQSKHTTDTQLELHPYDGTRELRDVETLTRGGIERAANDLIALLNEATTEPPLRSLPVTVFDIAKYRLNITEENIPPHLVERFYKVVHQVQDERYRLKSWVEEWSDYQLVMVNDKGHSALTSSRRPAVGFNLRQSEAGLTDDSRQLKMAIGKAVSITSRRPDLLEAQPFALSALEGLAAALVPLAPKLISPTENGEECHVIEQPKELSSDESRRSHEEGSPASEAHV